MVDQVNVVGEYVMFVDFGVVGNVDVSGYGGMIVDLYVVCDYDLVVQFYIVVDQCIGQCFMVDGGVCVDFDVVIDGYFVDLGDFLLDVFFVGEIEIFVVDYCV